MSWAAALPIPDPAPVTRATLPASCIQPALTQTRLTCLLPLFCSLQNFSSVCSKVCSALPSVGLIFVNALLPCRSCIHEIPMTFITQDETIRSNVEAFQRLDVDQQLALFYFIYKEMGGAITPAAPGASTVSPEIAEGLFNQVKDLSHEEQLQLQRDLITHKNSLFAREYGSVGDTTRLLFWYRLAQD